MKLKTLTKKQIKHYLEEPASCPYCEHDDLYYGEIEMDGTAVTQAVACKKCLRGWLDRYTLDDVVELEPVCFVCDDPVMECDEVAFDEKRGYRHAECVPNKRGSKHK